MGSSHATITRCSLVSNKLSRNNSNNKCRNNFCLRANGKNRVYKYDYQSVVNAKPLSTMRYEDDINTEQNMKSIGRTAVAQWTKRLTRNGQTRVRIWKGANILLLQEAITIRQTGLLSRTRKGCVSGDGRRKQLTELLIAGARQPQRTQTLQVAAYGLEGKRARRRSAAWRSFRTGQARSLSGRRPSAVHSYATHTLSASHSSCPSVLSAIITCALLQNKATRMYCTQVLYFSQENFLQTTKMYCTRTFHKRIFSDMCILHVLIDIGTCLFNLSFQ